MCGEHSAPEPSVRPGTTFRACDHYLENKRYRGTMAHIVARLVSVIEPDESGVGPYGLPSLLRKM